MKRIIVLVLIVLICFSFYACGVESQTINIVYGEEYVIKLEKQQEGLVWQSVDSDIVTVQNGTVTGVGPGESVVTATKDGKTVAEVNVTVSLVDVSAILCSQEKLEIDLEDSFQLQYVLVPDNASSYGLVWKSTNPEIVEVDENGNIRAISPGTTTIVCSAENGVFDTCEVTVKAPSAIEQLNEDEKLLFDIIVADILPSFYNAPAMRLRKIEVCGESDDFTDSMMLLLNVQGTNRLGGTLFKDYMLMYNKETDTSFCLPAITEDGLADRTAGVIYTETSKLDYTKINAALDEYWSETVYN